MEEKKGMKRSEMINFIRDELMEIFQNLQYSNESDEKYFKRKATGLLDMLEGFDMLPPTREFWVEIPEHNILGAGFKIRHRDNKWLPEDEQS